MKSQQNLNSKWLGFLYINALNVFLTITGNTALILPELISEIFFDQISMKNKYFFFTCMHTRMVSHYNRKYLTEFTGSDIKNKFVMKFRRIISTVIVLICNLEAFLTTTGSNLPFSPDLTTKTNSLWNFRSKHI